MVSHAPASETGSGQPIDTVLVPIDAELVASIDDLVGPDGRRAFVRSVLSGGVRRAREVRNAIDALHGATIPERDTPESTEAWMREIRGRSPESHAGG